MGTVKSLPQRQDIPYRNHMHLVTQIMKNLIDQGAKPLDDGTYFVVANEPIGDFRLRPASTKFQHGFERKWKAIGKTRVNKYCYFLEMKTDTLEAIKTGLAQQKELEDDSAAVPEAGASSSDSDTGLLPV